MVALIVGACLIWVGAAVTTTGSGMAFSDWPLSNGSVNPSGWLSFPPQLLEHGHRLLATTTGLLVLAMFLWQWILGWPSIRPRGGGRPLFAPVVLIMAFVLLLILVHAADGLYKGSESHLVSFFRDLGMKPGSLWILSGMLFGGIGGWLLQGWLGGRWPLLLKLTATALVTVVLQAVLGGLRVLEVSDPFGIAHGCLGQLLYCLMIAIALASSVTWTSGSRLGHGLSRIAVGFSTALFVATSLQLLFGAIVRHTQRMALAATDILTTGGHFVPPTHPADVFTLFLHKSWALMVFALAMCTAAATWKAWRGQGWPAALPKILFVLPYLQITLGVYVVLTAKKFWVTNVHVINGLLILAVSFSLMLLVRRQSAAVQRR